MHSSLNILFTNLTLNVKFIARLGHISLSAQLDQLMNFRVVLVFILVEVLSTLDGLICALIKFHCSSDDLFSAELFIGR